MDEHYLVRIADLAYAVIGTINWPWFIFGLIVLAIAEYILRRKGR